jgi:prophage regulatory protein
MKANRSGLSENLHPEQRLRMAQVQALTGLGKSKIYADIKLGLFPAPERSGKKCSRWRAASVLAFLNSKVKA